MSNSEVNFIIDSPMSPSTLEVYNNDNKVPNFIDGKEIPYWKVTPYIIGDFVSSSDGELYVCITAHTPQSSATENHLTDTAKWRSLKYASASAFEKYDDTKTILENYKAICYHDIDGLSYLFKTLDVFGSNTAPAPTVGIDTNWSMIEVLNKYAILDNIVDSQTKANDKLTVYIKADRFDGVGLLNIAGQDIRITTVNYDTNTKQWVEEFQIAPKSIDNQIDSNKQTLSIQNPNILANTEHEIADYFSQIADYYEYFFGQIKYIEDIYFIDTFNNVNQTIKIEIFNNGGVSKVGKLILGTRFVLGDLLTNNLTFKIKDYSEKTTTKQGFIYIKEGYYAKETNFNISVDTNRFDIINKTLAKYRSKPVLVVGANGFESLSNFGIITFSNEYKNSKLSNLNLKVLGVV